MLSWGSLFSLAAYLPLYNFWPLLMASVIFGIFWTSIMPLTESIVMTEVKLKGLNYGRMRLWGSLTFILASLGGGLVIDRYGEETILYLMLAAVTITTISVYSLPRNDPQKQMEKATPLPPIHWRDALQLMRSPLFILFLLTSAGIQATHAIYYGFGTLHWQSLHIATGMIGALWAVGVIAEVTLFAWSKPLIERLGPTRLLIVAALGAIVRWTLTAFDPPLGLLFVVQALHALSFGAAHLGAIYFIARAVPENCSATGQGLYAAVSMGIVMGFMTMISGRLYTQLGPHAYLVMSALALLSLAGAVRLHCRWRGAVILSSDH